MEMKNDGRKILEKVVNGNKREGSRGGANVKIRKGIEWNKYIVTTLLARREENCETMREVGRSNSFQERS